MTMKRITSIVILLCMLLSMFTLPGVGAASVDTADTSAQTDVAELGANVSDGTIIYFDASNYAASGSVIQFMIGHDSWSQGYPMTKVSNSNLYYVKMAIWEGATEYAIFGCNEEWGGEGSSVSNRKNWAPWATKVMSAVNLSGTVILTANTSGTLSKSSASLNTTQTATACYRDSNSGSYSTGTTGGTVSVSGYNVSGTTGSSKSSSTSGTGISAGIGTTVTMKATAKTGYTFQGWYSSTSATSAVSTSATYTYTNTGSATTYYAKFQLNGPYTVTTAANNSSYGTVSAGSSSVYYGKTTTLTATPKTGYYFSKWAVNNSSYGSLSSTTAKSPTLTVYNNVTATATFTAISAKVTFSAGTGGTVSSTGGSTSGTGSKSSTATANTGYTFTGWTISGGTLNTNYKITSGSTSSNSITIQPLTDGAAITAKANFSETAYTVTVKSNNTSYGTVSPTSASAGYGDTKTLTATPKSGYHFSSWSLNSSSYGKLSSTTATSTTLTVYNNVTVTGTFAANSGKVTYSAGTGGTVSSTGGTTSANGSKASTATANTGYTFTGWTISGGTLNTDYKITSGSTSSASITIQTLTHNAAITAKANFSVKSYTVTFKDWDGTVLATRTVNHGSAATAPSNPTRTGYTFKAWDKTFSSITADTTVTATYTINTYTVTFKDYDGTTIATRTVNYGSAATAPSDPTRSGFEFTGWDTDFSNVTSNLTVTAQYKDVRVLLPGSFNGWDTASSTMTQNSDGTYSKSLTLEPGTYTFKVLTEDVWYGNYGTIEDTTSATSSVGWEMVEGHDDCTLKASGGTYTFTFNKSTRMLFVDYTPTTYTVTFKNWDGTTLKSESVAIGKSATAPSNPTRTATAQYTYTFSGWDKDFSNITSNLTVTAQYTSTVNKYTVTFKDWDGTVLKTQSVEYGSSATPPSDPFREGDSQYAYTFSGWSGTYTNVTANSTVTAQYTSTTNKYTVTFKDYDGTVLATRTVAYGASATPPSTPTRTGYTFTGWSGSYTNVTANITVTAQYTVSTYTVTFKDWDGTVLATKTVTHGSSATAPSNPSRTGYTFKAWDKSFTNVTSNLTVTATYTINSYTVTFKDYDGTTLATRTVNYGSAAEAPADPTRTGYKFAGWDKDFSKITSNLTVTAKYTALEVNLVGDFNSWDTTSGKMTMSSAGVYTTTLELAAGSYKFKIISDGTWLGNWGTIEDTTTTTSASGWEMDAAADDCTLAATGGTYTFTYNTSTKMLIVTYKAATYTVTFKDYNGTTLKTVSVTAGSAATAPSDPTRIGYEFTGWDKDFSKVTSDLTVTAQYSEIEVFLLGGFNDWSTSSGKMAVSSDKVYTKTLNLSAGTYNFKILSNDVWYGNNGTIEDTTTTTSSIGWEMVDGYGECTLKATGGAYKFTFNTSTKMLVVEYAPAYYTVVFKDWDGSTLSTQSIAAGKAATAPATPTRTGYTFKAWDKDFSNITADTTVTATYTINSYTVTFKDWNGTVLNTQTVTHGSAATAPSNPTRTGYTFKGWDKAFTNITANTTVTAEYNVNYYTVTFKDWDGTVLKTESVAYGSDATPPEDPTREGDSENTYTFSGWDTSYKNITGDTTIKATYSTEEVYYTVTFKDHDGTVLKTESVAYGTAATAPATPTRTGYTFKAWDKSFTKITTDTIVTATYTINSYTVTFKDYDGTTLATKTVEYGSAAEAPAAPTRNGYKFTGWDKDFSNITANLTVTAQYTALEVNLVGDFNSWDTTSGKMTMSSDGVYTTTLDLASGSYKFKVIADGIWLGNWGTIEDTTTTTSASGWEMDAAADDCTLAATGGTYTFTYNTSTKMLIVTYKAAVYTVTFKDWDGTVLSTQSITAGSAATAPSDPSRTGYKFKGWDKEFSKITSDLTVTAQYTAIEVNLVGDFNSWTASSGKMTQSSDNIYTMSINLETGTYKFKIIADGTWYGNWGTIEDTTTATSSVGWEMDASANDCTLNATGGIYTFNYNISTKMLEVLCEIDGYVVTFKDWDGTVLSTAKVDVGTAAKAPANPTREGYTFTGWDKDFSNITSNLTVTAQYSVNYYTVKFVDWNGTVLKSESVAYGSDATPPADPTRESDGENTYTFSGWSGTYKNIKADTTITATYSTEEVTYTVTFVDWNGTVLKEETVLYGSSAEAPADPTREGYTFKEWDKDFSKITGDTTVTATYIATVFTVTFKDWNGTVLATKTVDYGTAATAPADPTRVGYKFIGWDKDFSNIKSNLTVTAQYNEIQSILVGDFNGWSTAFGKMSMTSDKIYTISLSIEPGTYKFKIIADGTWYGNWGTIKNTTTTTSSVGWEMDASAEDCTIVTTGGVYTFTYNISTKMLEVVYEADRFVVTFKDHDGTTLKTETVAAGASATAPATPAREGHTFAGWDKAFTNITENTTVTATYTINSYKVTFVNYDGTVLSTQTVEYGSAAEAPEVPARDGYVFKNWDKDFTNITADTTVTAVFVKDVVFIAGSFNDWSTSTAMTKSGDIYTYTAQLEPGTYTFKFIYKDVWYGNDGTIEDTTLTTSTVGWEMAENTGNCTLTASGGAYTFNYNASTRMLEVVADIEYYTVTFVNYDGTVIDTQTVKRSSSATAPADPERERDEQYTYTFTGWDVDFSNVQGNLTVTATFAQALNKYTVTFVNDDGTVLKTEEVEHGSAATAPEDPTKEGNEFCTFTFSGWDTDFSVVTSDLTVTATYLAEGDVYTVTFVDWDGTVLSTQTVVYSTSAIAPEDPVREGDEEYSYVFSGWDTDFSYITEDLTVTATYTLTVNTYTVTFVNYDGTVLKTQLVAYGEAATAPDTPSRPTTAQFRFTFDGWDTDFSCITGDTTVKATYTASVNGSGGSTGIYNLAREVQQGQILQVWCWSYNNVKKNLQTIASQGFSAIQVSPIQPIKESTRNGWNTLMNSSWVIYQPVAFNIETNSFNAQGTKSEFKSMCSEAHKYGIKVIVDVVFNHTANDMSENTIHPWVPEDLRNNPDCWHDISKTIYNFDNRYDVTHYCLTGLPDLNTGHPTVQWHCTNLLKEAIAAGADGFRIDAAKHIETDWDADGIKSDFWMNVLGEATAYAQSTRGFTPYYYGEILGSAGGGLSMSAYTRYMSITETSSNDIRYAITQGNAAGAVIGGMYQGESPSKAVMFTETHDTYKDSGTRFISDADINKTWAIVGSRANICGLYMARPYNIDTTLMGAADVTSWSYPEVKAVNQFKNHFVGQGEYLSSYYQLACVERGSTGMVIVNTGGTYYNGMSAPVHTMAEGYYKDAITGNIFTVSGGWIYGDIGDTGIAVIYEAADKGTFTAGSPTDFNLVGTFNDWDSAANKLVASDDKSASTVLYLEAGTYSFKLTTDSDLWYSNAGTIIDSTGTSPWSMYTSVSEDCTLVASGGKYTFTFNSVTGKLSVDYQATADYSSNMYLKGTFNDWGTGNRMTYTGQNNIVTTTMNLDAGTYTFKLNDTGYGTWYSNAGTITDTTATGGSSGWDMSQYVTDDCTLVTTGGTYTFNFNMGTHKLVVLHQPYTYTVVFKDYDGTVISSQTVERGAAAVAPDVPDRESDGTYAYLFSGWDKDFSNITSDLVVTAQYTAAENSYAVTFKDWNGDVLSSQFVKGGEDAVAPADPVRANNAQFTYTFTGWDKEFTNIQTDTIVTAQYDIVTNQYTVTFTDWDGTLLGTSTVDYGTSAVAPQNPTREGSAQYSYEFTGWSKDFSKVIEDMETVAVYNEITNQYTVTFKTWDGSVISTQSVYYGSGAWAPETPTRDGYLFTGWDTDFSYITGDLTVNAYFAEDIVYLKGDFNGWGTNDAMTATETDGVVSVKLAIEAGTYGFKLNRVYYWYGNGGTIEDTTLKTSEVGWGMSDSNDANCTLKASGGYYTFRFNKNTAYLEIFHEPFAYTVTFVDYDGTVLKAEEVMRGEAATAPNDPVRDGYAFTGWDVAFDNITEDITVTATYQKAGENEHIVTFVNWDDTVVAQVIVENGKAAEAPVTPTKEGDAQYSYVFAGWDTEITNVTSDMTVKATYTQVVNSYTVTFVDYDGTVLSEQVLEYGLAAEAPGAPAREADAQYTYTFKGWDKDFTNVASDLTVTAQYDAVLNTYTVTFVNYDGAVLSTQQVGYGTGAQAPETPTREGYLFTGWDKEFTNITGELTVTATFAEDIVYLRGNFNNWGKENEMTATETAGVVSVTIYLEAGTYTFKINRVNSWYGNAGTIEDTTLNTSDIGWGMSDTEGENCTLKATGGYYTFRFNKDTAYLEVLKGLSSYTVTFVDYDGTVLKEEEVAVGKSATAPEAPVREGYVFTGWDVAFDKVTEDLTVTAVYDALAENKFVVTFVDFDGTVLNIQTVIKGEAAEAPEAPVREGDAQYTYNFTGWDADFTNVTSDLTVTAQYETIVNKYTVNFVDYSGAVLSTQQVEYGSAAEAPETPVRDKDAQYTYTFKGWDKDFTNITEDLTVTAQYDATLNIFTVTFKNYDGTVLSTQQVEYGKSATAPADPEKAGYIFAGWDKDFTNVTADITVTATFGEDVVYLLGTFNEWATDTEMTAADGDNILSVTLEIPAGNHEFQILHLGKWLGNTGTIEDTTVTTSDIGWEMNEGAGNCKLNVSGGEYTFTFNKETRMLVIEYTPIEYMVIFIDIEGEIIEEQYVLYGADAVAPEAPEVEGYTFIGWDPEYTNVQAHTPVFAMYEEGIIEYAVTFVSSDGTVISEQTVRHGKGAEAPEPPAKKGHVFTGWDIAFDKVTEDIVVTAQYVEDIVYLRGSFNDWATDIAMSDTETDNVVTATLELEAGTYYFQFKYLDKSYGNIGVIEDTTDASTEFGWAMDEGAVDCTLNATGGTYTFILYKDSMQLELKHTPVQYTVTFVDWNGTVLKTETVANGSAAEAPEDPVRDGYTFAGWDVAFDKITEDLTVTATYTLAPRLDFMVTFVDWDGTVLSQQIVPYGEDAVAPADPVREGYIFLGWDALYENIGGDTLVTALYVNDTVYLLGSFNDWESTALTATETENVVSVTYELEAGTYYFQILHQDIWHGNTGIIEDTTVKTSDVGWKMLAGASNATLKATGGTYTINYNKETKFLEVIHTPIEYKVTFVDWDGTVLSEQTVINGSAAVAPEAPSREGHIFTGWDVNFSAIKADTVVTAVYVENSTVFTVTFVDYDGTVLGTQEVLYGVAATAPETPAREGYSFTGWDKDFTKITADLTVTAQYVDDTVYLYGSFNEWVDGPAFTATETENVVSITIELAAGTHYFQILHQDKWHGNMGVIEDTTLSTSEIGWEMTEGAIDCTLNATGGMYTFNYNKETRFLEVIYAPIECTVTFKDWDGTVLKTVVVMKGKDAEAPADPVREGYVFTGWNKAYNNIQADTEVTATYLMAAITYTVTFLDWNGAIIDTQIVTTGEAAKAPKEPKRDGYAFTGWDKDFSNITYNLYVNAQYVDIRYYLLGSFNEWETDEFMASADEIDIVTKTLTLEAGTYTFKIYQNGVWFGNEGVIEDTTLATSAIGWEMIDGAVDCTLKATGGTYTFNFNANTNFLEIIYTPIQYKVTFVDWDGTVLSEQTVALGVAPVAPEAPTRDGYIFIKWDTDFSDIKADTVVKAIYEEETVEYTVQFVDWDGTVLSTQKVGYKEFATPPESPTRDGYVFIGWDKNFREVTSDLIITARYMETNVYLSADFNDWNEEVAMVASDDEVTYTYEITLPKGEYEFKIITYETWYGNEGVIEDTTVTSSDIGWAMLGYANNCGFKASGGKYVFNFNIHTAMLEVLYTPIQYTVTFVDMNGKTISEQKVNLGAAAVAPTAPAVEGYIFTGWDTKFTNVKANTVVSPVYIKDTTTYTVTFTDFDGTVLDTQQVEYGKSAKTPADPTRAGYIFTGWDKDFTNITADLTVKAQYKDNQIYLTGSFNNWDKKLYLEREGESSVFSTQIAFVEGTYYFKLYQNDVWYSSASTIIDTTDVTSKTGIELRPEDYLGDTILNASGGTYTFKFDTLTNKLIVLYSEELISYTVTFVDYNGTVLATETVYLNNPATAPEAPVRENDAQYTYTFNGWDVDFSHVTSDLTVTATYLQTVNTYTVTFVDTDGTVLKEEVVEYGMSATAPEMADREGLFFDGWDKDFSAVMEDMTVTALFISENDRVASNVTIAGTFNGWDASATPFYTTADDDKVTVNMTLEAGSYEFKVVIDGGNWFGYDGTITDVTYGSGVIMSNYAGNCKLEATGGTYTFTYYKSTSTLSVGFDGEIDEDVVLYTVTFVDTDGTVIAEVTVVSGSSASAPAAPAKDGYVFTGWDKDFSSVTEDMTVTAQYIAGSYSNVGIAGDFNGWNSGANTFIKPASGGLLTMTMNIAGGTYKFKVVDDGNWLGNGGVIIDTNIASSADSGWEFYGDAGDCTLVATGGNYTFKYDPDTHTLQILFDGESNAELPTFTVKFIDWNGTILKTQQVKIGSAATAPSNPYRSGYKFTGWSCDFGYVTSDLDVYAHYMDNSVYLMGIKDWETGTRMSHVSGNTYRVSITLAAGEYGFKVKHGDNWYGNNGWLEDTTDYTSETGWEFTGDAGNCTLKAIGSTYTFTFNTSTRMMKVTYIAPSYTVTFKNWNGSVISTQTVKRGSAATAPATPTKEGYVFAGWDRDFSWIYEDTVVTAQFAENNVNLMGDFNSWSGTPMTSADGTVYSVTIDLAAGTYGFKIKHAASWYGNSGTIKDSASGCDMSTDVGDNCTFVASGGTYTFSFDMSSKKITVTHDSSEMTGGSTVIGNINIMGDFNEWSGTAMTNMYGTIYTVTVDLAAGTYGFKIKIGESWYGNSGTIQDTTATSSETGWDMSTDVGDNCTLIATGGTYAFNYDTATNKLIILYGDAVLEEQGVSLMGTFNEWAGVVMTTEDDIIYTITVELEAGTHKFKIKNGLSWLGCSGVINDSTETELTLSETAGDCTLKALGGTYEIKFNSLTNTMTVINLSNIATGDEATPDEATPDEYKVTVNTSDNFTIVTDADMNAIAGGSNFSFSVDVKEGYILNAVVYNMTVLTAVDGVYTIENVASDIVLIIVAIEDTVTIKPMEFTVTFTDKDGNVLKTETVEYGKAATAPEAPAVDGYTFKAWDTEFDYVTMDITVKATYKKNAAPIVPATTGTLKVEVSGGASFTIALGDSVARPQGSTYLNTTAPIGVTVTLTAVANGREFIGWINPANGHILSTDLTYTFVTSGNDFIKATFVTQVEGVQMVTFKNDKANVILDAQYYTSTEAIIFPDAPTQVGFDFVGWSMTEVEIQAAIAAGEDVTVFAVWTRQQVYVNVTVTGGTGGGKVLANAAVTVVADAAPAGQKFAYWADANGVIKSYSTSYKFYPAADTALTAVFVAEDAEIEQNIIINLDYIDYAAQASANKAVFGYSWELPTKYTIVKAGLVAVNKDNYNEATLVAGSSDSNVYDRSSSQKTSTGTGTWTKSNVFEGQTWVAKAYIQYYDENGVLQTVYSDLFEATKE